MIDYGFWLQLFAFCALFWGMGSREQEIERLDERLSRLERSRHEAGE